jgi:hypothetical protein
MSRSHRFAIWFANSVSFAGAFFLSAAGGALIAALLTYPHCGEVREGNRVVGYDCSKTWLGYPTMSKESAQEVAAVASLVLGLVFGAFGLFSKGLADAIRDAEKERLGRELLEGDGRESSPPPDPWDPRSRL